MVVYREMNENDIECVAVLEADTFADAWTKQGIYDTFCQKQAFITVAELSGKLLGYCITYFVLDEGEIARVAVDSEYRREGIGKGLLNYTCACCRERNVNRLLLDVRESNEGAIKFYKMYGFTTDGVRKNFYDAPKENAILMSKALE